MSIELPTLLRAPESLVRFTSAVTLSTYRQGSAEDRSTLLVRSSCCAASTTCAAMAE